MIYIAALENWESGSARYISITHSGPRNEIDPVTVAPDQTAREALSAAGWKITSGERVINGKRQFTVGRESRTSSTVDATSAALTFLQVHPQLIYVARIIVEQADPLMTLKRWFRAIVSGESGSVPMALMLGVGVDEALGAKNSVELGGGFDAVNWEAISRDLSAT